jgi:hypothetical protein
MQTYQIALQSQFSNFCLTHFLVRYRAKSSQMVRNFPFVYLNVSKKRSGHYYLHDVQQ